MTDHTIAPPPAQFIAPPYSHVVAANISAEEYMERYAHDHYGDKLAEYEANGVREYWIIDPMRQRSTFYRLNNAGQFDNIAPDSAGNQVTPLLADFVLHTPTLWTDPLPDMVQTIDAVKQILEQD